MLSKSPIVKMLAFLLLGAVLMIGAGVFYNGHKSVFKNGITPIEKVDTNRKVVAIACNVYEGENVLPTMLETLEKHDTKISFFIGGVWGKKNINLIKTMKDSGHDIQNHGYYHKKPTQLSEGDNIKEIQMTSELLKNEVGVETTIFEPPYGDFDEYTQKMTEKANHKLVTFNMDTIDWREDASREVLVKRISKKLNPGGIILMHPKEVTSKSLEDIILYLKSQDYEILTVNELLKLKD